MQQQITLHISEPCHEDWNRMTTTQQGKFCSACSKQVIDFSLMTDQQILTFLSQHSSMLCGRFQQEQLERTLVEKRVYKRKSLWLAFTLPFVILFQKSFGQRTVPYKTETATHIKNEPPAITVTAGGITIRRRSEPTIMHGRVTDEKSSPVRYATILINETGQRVISDSSGRFSFNIIDKDSITLTTESIGYKRTEKRIGIENTNEEVSVVMQMQPALLGEVVVVGYATKRMSDRVGAVSVCRKMTTTEKIDSVFKKIVKRSPFTIYPNPAAKGSSIHVTVKQSGRYELQLLDNNSNLIRTQQADELSNDATVSFLIPGTISSGIYYLRMIDVNKKTSSLEKLVVQ